VFQLDFLPHFRYLFFKTRIDGLKKAQFDQILFQKIDTPWNSKLLKWKSNLEILWTPPFDFNKFPIHLGMCMHPLSFTPYLNVLLRSNLSISFHFGKDILLPFCDLITHPSSGSNIFLQMLIWIACPMWPS